MKVTTLVENLTYKSGLLAEHGLSFYIETANRKILFDTGQSDVFVRNALAMGIDLTEVDAVVISHGHYDHAGGLNTFLRLNQKAKVYLKRAALFDKYSGTSRYVGAAADACLASGRLVFVDDLQELDQGLFIIPQTPIVNPADTHFKGFLVKKETLFEEDTFVDELFLVADSVDGISIISSCSHRGITNMVEAAISAFKKKIKAVVGGFHLLGCTPEQLEATICYFEQLAPKSLGICHCTGIDRYGAFVQRLGSVVFYNSTGTTFEL
ncbi:MBL fold metallo-hydrolase [uncultured Acetobacteroides sp.]|uniref:MBL fold metallo-hydrolase n=1 Tax=uncultured Acetobacteroides sp. TaxID=1760811 RepID=UPI0029F4C543|nr:MBL fold metallo-hydrolase [uncultured Acetobacteroides sp.]